MLTCQLFLSGLIKPRMICIWCESVQSSYYYFRQFFQNTCVRFHIKTLLPRLSKTYVALVALSLSIDRRYFDKSTSRTFIQSLYMVFFSGETPQFLSESLRCENGGRQIDFRGYFQTRCKKVFKRIANSPSSFIIYFQGLLFFKSDPKNVSVKTFSKPLHLKRNHDTVPNS